MSCIIGKGSGDLRYVYHKSHMMMQHLSGMIQRNDTFAKPPNTSVELPRAKIKFFRVTGPFCAGNSPGTGEFPAKMPVTRSFDVSFDQDLNKRLRKQSWGWWFETPSCSLCLQRNISEKCLPRMTVNVIFHRFLATCVMSLVPAGSTAWGNIHWDNRAWDCSSTNFHLY